MAAIINEGTQYLDTSGTPLVGGKIYVGVADADPVLNPIPIFSDRELTTPLTNPQIIDSDGRSINKIWLVGRFSLQIDDVNDTLQFQELDNGSDSSSTPTISLGGVQNANDIVATTGAGITSYTGNQKFVFVAVASNTGNVTLNVDGVGALSILTNNGAEVASGEFQTGRSITVTYNATTNRFSWDNFSIVNAALLDEDDMASDSDVFAATQSSIKTYVDDFEVRSRTVAKAWINLDGTDTSITDSFNVTSITDAGTGQTEVNFTNVMASAGYSAPCSAQQPHALFLAISTASAMHVLTQNGGNAATDTTPVGITIHGDLA